MLTQFVMKILIDNNIIKETEYEIIHYGLSGIFSTFCGFITTFLIGFFFNCLLESIYFTIIFFFLRIYAGGYHAEPPTKCYFISVGISFFNFAIVEKISWNPFFLTVLLIISSIIIFIMAPVDNINKSLNLVEKKIYQEKSRIIVSILMVLYIIFFFFENSQLCWCISIACTNSCALLIIGYIKNLLIKKFF